MKKITTIVTTLLIILSGIAWIGFSNSPHPISFKVPKGWPAPVYDFKNNPLTQEGIALGKQLFYDGQLSKNGKISCGSCHQQYSAFATFDHALSHGYNNGQTTRNAASLQNLAWQKTYMADGGINDLHLEPLVHITAPNEMAESIENVIRKLKADTHYASLFKAAFGDPLINTERLGKALSQFMLTLVSANSKYDQVMRGEASFILPEQLGYEIFQKKCVSCHPPPFFSDFNFRNIGLPIDNFLKDKGRMKITNNPKDSLLFKVPSLRNIALTAPYGHDGRFNSLLNVLEHYRKNMVLGPTTDSLLKNRLPLSNFEIGQIRAFLNTLTDSSFLQEPKFAAPGIGNNRKAPIHEH